MSPGRLPSGYALAAYAPSRLSFRYAGRRGTGTFGLSQAELAAFIGRRRSHLADVEAGRKQLGPDQRLQVLAR